MRGIEVAAIAVLTGGVAAAAPADWLGSDKCAGCHPAEVAAWKAGPHAGATGSLDKHRRRQACLGCHATGEAPAGKALFDGVGCESCHGPGAGYGIDDVMRDPPLATALGLVALASPSDREPVCRRCHQRELGRSPFDVEAAWRKLPHGKGSP